MYCYCSLLLFFCCCFLNVRFSCHLLCVHFSFDFHLIHNNLFLLFFSIHMLVIRHWGHVVYRWLRQLFSFSISLWQLLLLHNNFVTAFSFLGWITFVFGGFWKRPVCANKCAVHKSPGSLRGMAFDVNNTHVQQFLWSTHSTGCNFGTTESWA